MSLFGNNNVEGFFIFLIFILDENTKKDIFIATIGRPNRDHKGFVIRKNPPQVENNVSTI